MKTFVMKTGSGKKILDGVVFPDGQTVVKWVGDEKQDGTLAVHSSFDDFETMHVKLHPVGTLMVTWTRD